MNNPFLHRIVDTLINKKLPLEQTKLILPGKRPEVFIRKLFQEKNYNGFLPEFYSIEQFAQEIAGKMPISGIPLWIRSFEIFKKIDPEESFENFLKWIPTVLKDFNEIDIYTANPEALLDYMVALERIESWEIDDYSGSELLMQNRLFWEKLKPFYQNLHQSLNEGGEATSGMMFRQAAEKAGNYLQNHENDYFVFAGFNALSPVEKSMFSTFADSDKTLFLWDIDHYYYDDVYQEAGAFFREYARDFPQFKVDADIVNEFEKPKNIKSIGCPKQVIQSKYLADFLKDTPTDDLNSTAVILCDENALNSVLESIPEEIQDINVTMGYPLMKNELILFFERIFKLQEKSQSRNKVYVKDLLDLLSSYSFLDFKEENIVRNFQKEMLQQKKLYIDINAYPELQQLSLFPLISTISGCGELLKRSETYCKIRRENKYESRLQQTVYEKLREVFQSLSKMTQEHEISLEVMPNLFHQLVKNSQLDFIGKPVEGLQIMGLLETRLLNFERIILLNVNEGVIPLGRTENSFIPFDVKKRFKIDTFLENDSVYAYHFFRLLQSAKTIDLLYNEVSEALQSGEKSRFISQIELESTQKVQNLKAKANPDIPVFSDIKTIQKTPEIIQRIDQWLYRFVSPSSLNSYLYNAFDFFQSYILGIRNEDEFEERFSAQVMGTIIHGALENMYQPFVKSEENQNPKAFNVNNLEALLPQIENYLNDSIKEEGYPTDWFDKGSNLIEKKLAERMLQNLIKSDIRSLKEGNTIEILELEKFYKFKAEHPAYGEIEFGGYIDRIDRINGMLRVIDYKTGKPKVLSTHDRSKNLKPFTADSAQIIQLSLYAEMAFANFPDNQVLCGIYSLKRLNDGVHYLNCNGSEIINPAENTELMASIFDIISEIKNPDIPFEVEIVESYF